MPKKTKVTKHEIRRRKPAQKERYEKEFSDDLGPFADGEAESLIVVDGANIRAEAFADVEDRGTATIEDFRSGEAELLITVDNCACEEWQGKARLQVVQSVGYSAVTAGGTYADIGGYGLAKAFGKDTKLNFDVKNEAEEIGEVVGLDKTAKDFIAKVTAQAGKGDVEAKGELKFSSEQDHLYLHRRKLRYLRGGRANFALHNNYTKDVSLSCGTNRFPYSSFASIGLTSSVAPSDDPKDRYPDTDWRRASLTLEVRHEIRAEQVSVVDCGTGTTGDKPKFRVFPPPAVTQPSSDDDDDDRLLSMGDASLRTRRQLALNFPDVGIEDGRAAPARLHLVALTTPVTVVVSTSNPEVVALEQTEFSVEPGTEQLDVPLEVRAAGEAELSVEVPEIGFADTKPITVVDFADEPNDLALPQSVSAEVGAITEVDFRVRGQEQFPVTVEVADPETATVAIVGRPEGPVGSGRLWITGESPGRTMVSVSAGPGRVKKIAVDVEPARTDGLVSADSTMETWAGEPDVLPLRLQWLPAGPTELTVTSSDPDVVAVCTREISVPTGQSRAALVLYGLKAGRAVVEVRSASGSTCTLVEVNDDPSRLNR